MTSPLRWLTTSDSGSRSGSTKAVATASRTRDGIEIHLGVVPDADARTAAAYLFVDDAGELARVWRATGADVRGPEDTEWGQHEGVVIDPDGNVIRFGSPMTS